MKTIPDNDALDKIFDVINDARSLASHIANSRGSDILDDINEPYFVDYDELPGLDFNREIIEPNTHDEFPDGAVGIRVDGDFWAVAALPYSYLHIPLKDIVKRFWPQYINEATYEPDSGSMEQKLRFSNLWAKSKEETIQHYSKINNELQEELKRLRAGRYDLHERHSARHKANDDYFVRQYEHLLTAMAHNFVAKPKPLRGICRKCGLLSTDRVHMEKYIDLHTRGYDSYVKALCEFNEEEE